MSLTAIIGGPDTADGIADKPACLNGAKTDLQLASGINRPADPEPNLF